MIGQGNLAGTSCMVFLHHDQQFPPHRDHPNLPGCKRVVQPSDQEMQEVLRKEEKSSESLLLGRKERCVLGTACFYA